MDFKNLKLAPPDSLPLGLDMPLDNLMDIYRLAVHMEVLCYNSNGVGLAATQVNVPYNFFIALKESKFEYFVNCSYEGIGEKINSLEGCLSLRSEDGSLQQYEVQRFPKIILSGKQLVVSNQDNDLKLIDIHEEISGIKSIVCQHEIDHAKGILISHIGKQVYIQRK